MEEIHLRCNNMNCRKKLQASAYVTACSHIFCVSCSNKAFTEQLLCPVCQSALTGKFDIQQMDLVPNETYKSQILAGLSPEIVQDICFRSISMYMYQVSQEIQLQEIMYKQLLQKYKTERAKIQSREQNNAQVVNDLKRRLQSYEKQHDSDKVAITEIQQQLNQKTRICQKLQHMYDMNKKQSQQIHTKQENIASSRNTHSRSPNEAKKSLFKFNSFSSRFSNNSAENMSVASSAKSPIDILHTPRHISPSSSFS
eukprot:NODE_1_length_95616_cov_0.657642.p39 type:complete len:255 gc:universal NODE_1_length_95616_cov_0.657642:22898-23662(+)